MFDEDIVDSTDDLTGDRYGATLPDFPPEEPLGVEATGTTPVEEDAGESFAERSGQHRADTEMGDGDPSVDPSDLGPEAAAMHVEPSTDRSTADDTDGFGSAGQ